MSDGEDQDIPLIAEDPRRLQPLCYTEGFVELLFRDPGAPPVTQLLDLDAGEYDRRGGPLPLHEFFSMGEIYRHFANPAILELAPALLRPLNTVFDALNLVTRAQSRVLTMVFVPKEQKSRWSAPGLPFAYEDDLPLALAVRPRAFKPFLYDS